MIEQRKKENLSAATGSTASGSQADASSPRESSALSLQSQPISNFYTAAPPPGDEPSPASSTLSILKPRSESRRKITFADDAPSQSAPEQQGLPSTAEMPDLTAMSMPDKAGIMSMGRLYADKDGVTLKSLLVKYNTTKASQLPEFWNHLVERSRSDQLAKEEAEADLLMDELIGDDEDESDDDLLSGLEDELPQPSSKLPGATPPTVKPQAPSVPKAPAQSEPPQKLPAGAENQQAPAQHTSAPAPAPSSAPHTDAATASGGAALAQQSSVPVAPSPSPPQAAGALTAGGQALVDVSPSDSKKPSVDHASLYREFMRECKNREKFPVSLATSFRQNKVDLFHLWRKNGKDLFVVEVMVQRRASKKTQALGKKQLVKVRDLVRQGMPEKKAKALRDKRKTQGLLMDDPEFPGDEEESQFWHTVEISRSNINETEESLSANGKKTLNDEEADELLGEDGILGAGLQVSSFGVKDKDMASFSESMANMLSNDGNGKLKLDKVRPTTPQTEVGYWISTQ